MATDEDGDFGTCGCLCGTWGHDGCQDKATTYMVFGSQFLGSVAVPICDSCYQAIRERRRPQRLIS